MGYLLQNDGCYSTSTISSTSNPSGRRNGTCFTTHGMYTVYIESVIVIFFSKYCRNEWVPLSTVSIILKYPNVHMKPRYNTILICLWNQNLHWKLGQQTPSFGSLLAYLETTVRPWDTRPQAAWTFTMHVFE